MSRKIVHVVGTGTIGEPLIGLLSDFKNDLGINIRKLIYTNPKYLSDLFCTLEETIIS